MRLIVTLFCLLLTIAPQLSTAQTRERIGYGRLFTNDYLADQQDRWRTGSFASSRLWGYGFYDAPPPAIGEILELRLGAEIIAPDHLGKPKRGDRPFVGILSAGLHTHFRRAGADIALGTDLTVLGPQTRMDEFLNFFHGHLGMPTASDRVRDAQVPDAVHLSVVTEAGRNLDLPGAILRPFVEARGGVENLVRAGFDITFGGLMRDELLIRDAVTGHRYRTAPRTGLGFGFTLGADIAAVGDSVYLPAASGVVPLDRRERYRAGVHWQGSALQGFYGLTYLGEEFVGQPEGQLTGSVRIGLRF